MGFLVRFVAEILEFYEEVIRTKDVAEAQKGLEGLVVTTGIHQISHLSVATGGETDESFCVGRQ